MLRGVFVMFVGGLLLVLLVVSAAWFAVGSLIAAFVSWPGLIVVALVAVLAARHAARAATRPPTGGATQAGAARSSTGAPAAGVPGVLSAAERSVSQFTVWTGDQWGRPAGASEGE